MKTKLIAAIAFALALGFSSLAAPGDYSVTVTAGTPTNNMQPTARYWLDYPGNTNSAGDPNWSYFTGTAEIMNETMSGLNITGWVVESLFSPVLSVTTNNFVALTAVYIGDNGYPDYTPVTTSNVFDIITGGVAPDAQLGVGAVFTAPALWYSAFGTPITAEEYGRLLRRACETCPVSPSPVAGNMNWWDGYDVPGAAFELSYATTLGSWSNQGSQSVATNGYIAYTNPVSYSSLGFSRLVCTNNGGATTNRFTNVLGYAQMVFPQGKTAFAHPFSTVRSTVAHVFTNVPNNAGVLSQVGSSLTFVTNLFTGGAWSNPNQSLPAGKGFLFLNPNATAYTNLFQGKVPGGNLTNNPTGQYSLIANLVPKAGYLTDLGFSPGSEEINVMLWNGSAWIDCIWTPEDGWSDMEGFSSDPEKGPYIGIGQPLAVEKYGTANPTWIQTFIP